jgi:hypothetical protein
MKIFIIVFQFWWYNFNLRQSIVSITEINRAKTGEHLTSNNYGMLGSVILAGVSAMKKVIQRLNK